MKAMIMTNNENSKLIEKSYINKKQRKRSVFDFEQIRQLEYVFDQITHYPDLSIRQYLNHLTQLPDKKIQIWFQNRRAKWRKQHQLVHFGGLHELAIDGHVSFVPTPKSNVVQTSSSSVEIINNPPILQLEQFFYWAFQTTLTKNKDFEQKPLMKRHDLTFPTHFMKNSIASTNHEH